MPELWSQHTEEHFFRTNLKAMAPEKLFYRTEDGRWLAYWPNTYRGRKGTLQSRNAPIGRFTEQFAASLLKPVADVTATRVVRNAVCEEIGLTKQSPADVALCRSGERIQQASGVRLVVEVKMSIVWNWQLLAQEGSYEVTWVGDYASHTAAPSILRSDSVLKAIGKCVNVRVSGPAGAHVPLIVLANTPIAPSYYEKADHLKQGGIVQGFWSVNPAPRGDSVSTLKETPGAGFIRFDDYEDFHKRVVELLAEDRVFFSAMSTKTELGDLVEKAAREPTLELKAEKLISLLRGEA